MNGHRMAVFSAWGIGCAQQDGPIVFQHVSDPRRPVSGMFVGCGGRGILYFDAGKGPFAGLSPVKPLLVVNGIEEWRVLSPVFLAPEVIAVAYIHDHVVDEGL
jgi:hypothetical protein